MTMSKRLFKKVLSRSYSTSTKSENNSLEQIEITIDPSNLTESSDEKKIFQQFLTAWNSEETRENIHCYNATEDNELPSQAQITPEKIEKEKNVFYVFTGTKDTKEVQYTLKFTNTIKYDNKKQHFIVVSDQKLGEGSTGKVKRGTSYYLHNQQWKPDKRPVVIKTSSGKGVTDSQTGKEKQDRKNEIKQYNEQEIDDIEKLHETYVKKLTTASTRLRNSVPGPKFVRTAITKDRVNRLEREYTGEKEKELELIKHKKINSINRINAKLINQESNINMEYLTAKYEKIDFSTLASSNAYYSHRFVPKQDDEMESSYKMFLTMPIASGQPVQNLLEDGTIAKMELNERIKMIDSIVNEVKFFHTLGYVHHDLKGDNIFYENNKDEKNKPTVTLIDFGVTQKCGSPAETRGGMAYMDPALSRWINEDTTRKELTSQKSNDLYSISILISEIFLNPSNEILDEYNKKVEAGQYTDSYAAYLVDSLENMDNKDADNSKFLQSVATDLRDFRQTSTQNNPPKTEQEIIASFDKLMKTIVAPLKLNQDNKINSSSNKSRENITGVFKSRLNAQISKLSIPERSNEIEIANEGSLVKRGNV